MLKIEVGNITTKLIGDYPKWAIEPITSYEVHGRWFSEVYKKGMWDGKKRFIRKYPNYSVVPTGFVERICAKLDEIRFRYELIDEERDLDFPAPAYKLHGVDLSGGKWDFQGEILDAALARGRGVIKVPTGGGKTVIIAAITASYGKKTTILTHRQALLYQIHKTLEETLQTKVGIVGDGILDIQNITVAMVQTLSLKKRPEKMRWEDWDVLSRKKTTLLKRTKVLICDEVHHLKASQWKKLVTTCPAPYRFGLTATPCFSGSGMTLIGYCGEQIADVSREELIERGVLVQPRIWFVKGHHTETFSGNNYAVIYKNGITHNTPRNACVYLVASTFAHEQKKTITLVRRINHGEILLYLFTDRGLRCEFIEGRTSLKDREKIIRRLKEGDLDNIIAMDSIMGEGVDLPWLDCIVNATGTKGGGSQASDKDEEMGRGTLQILGRILRAYPGKNSCEYVDFADAGHRYLSEASLERARTLEENGYSLWMKHWTERTRELGREATGN